MLEEVGEVHVPNHEDDAPVLPGGYVPFPHGGEFPPNGLVGLPQGLLETVEGVGTVYVEFADGQVVHELFAEDTTGAEGENLVSRQYLRKKSSSVRNQSSSAGRLLFP